MVIHSMEDVLEMVSPRLSWADLTDSLKRFLSRQMRTEDSAHEKQKKRETFEFMKKFRETFSRPVCRIEFLGLFDCVNSVPQFESAWMSRTRFP